MVGVVRIWADSALNCCLDSVDVLVVLRLDDRGDREQSHVGSMKDRLVARDLVVFLAGSNGGKGGIRTLEGALHPLPA